MRLGKDGFDAQSGGTPAFRGGERHSMLLGIIGERRFNARQQMMNEPGRERARDAINYFNELEDAAFDSGQAGVDSVNTKHRETLRWLKP